MTNFKKTFSINESTKTIANNDKFQPLIMDHLGKES